MIDEQKIKAFHNLANRGKFVDEAYLPAEQLSQYDFSLRDRTPIGKVQIAKGTIGYDVGPDIGVIFEDVRGRTCFVQKKQLSNVFQELPHGV